MAIIAHLSGLAGNLFGGGGFIVPLIIMFTARSPVVVAIAKQAMMFNLAVLACASGLIVLAVTVILTPV
ncbi:MAG: DUF4870 domain-containing protein, partial [Planctomycetes bacterium]|nr:DUF4870 domain-containing protein [Planctomycetota bacterium]